MRGFSSKLFPCTSGCACALSGEVVAIVNRRSWPEITVEILEATLTPSNKTRVMYRSNLNLERFNGYLYDFLRKGFIEEKKGSKGKMVYKTTERGKTLMEVLRKAQELLSSEEHARTRKS